MVVMYEGYEFMVTCIIYMYSIVAQRVVYE
jgi:hypothetical protein